MRISIFIRRKRERERVREVNNDWLEINRKRRERNVQSSFFLLMRVYEYF
jgi:hypothetical protein